MRLKGKPCAADVFVSGSVFITLAVSVFLAAFPIVHILSASFSNPSAIASGKVFLLPVRPTLLGYRLIFSEPTVVQGMINSVLYLVGGTAFGLTLTMLTAYPLSRSDLPGRSVFTMFFLITMFIGGGMIPYYILIMKLKLINTPWVMILTVGVSAWNMAITRTYLQTTIPTEMREAAMLDNCGEMQFLLRIVLPLSKPILAVLVLMMAVAQWNNYSTALLFLRESRLYPIQMVLARVISQNTIDISKGLSSVDALDMQEKMYLSNLFKYTLIVVTSLPMMMLYPLLQKYFIKGIMVGSIKG